MKHVRYANGDLNERAVIKFTREDLLWRGRVGDVDVPTSDRQRLVGPTIVDMLVRHPGEVAGAGAHWTLRETSAFLERKRGKAKDGLPPFRAGLVSGGKYLAIDGDFVRVTKISSVSIGAYAYRLAVGALGSVRVAHDTISHKAAAAWSADLTRSRALYDAIQAAPGGWLQETAAVAALRPAGSISDAIETDILREACMLLGVDPDLNLRRAPGRPRKEELGETEAGDFIAVTVVDGVVSAKTITAIQGIPAHSDLGGLNLLKLVALLEALRQGGAQLDAELLEAFLDAAAPDWRETAGAAPADEPSASEDDPYEILGVRRDMDFDDITKAYRRAMAAMHPDKGACPKWFAQHAARAYRRIKDEFQTRSSS
jgi:hypothetical protein